ncbi:MAG TPA: NADH-quinone oxidoreductase subunit J [Gemmataceae bacterium]|nr:NADH-quinone oxidoreductase subunit J [Gemmataceae bacterium]
MMLGALSPWADHVWRVALPAALGLVAVYLLLPRPRPMLRVAGIALAFLAVVAAGFVLLHTSGRPVYDTLFYFFAFVAVVSGGMLVTHRDPVHAALSFALVVLSTCGLFLIMAAPFLMAATIIVYAGAIIVTFLFVIMLAQQQGLSDADSRSREPFLTTVACFVLLPTLLYIILQTYDTGQPLQQVVARATRAQDEKFNTVPAVVEASGGAGLLEDYRKALLALRWTPNAEEYQNQVNGPVNNLKAQWAAGEKAGNVKTLKNILADVQANGTKVLEGYAKLTPPPGSQVSQLSVPSKELHLLYPGETVAPLGRSLFTDYLIAVELAGTLLLVATIGTIAIAGRRTEGLR